MELGNGGWGWVLSSTAFAICFLGRGYCSKPELHVDVVLSYKFRNCTSLLYDRHAWDAYNTAQHAQSSYGSSKMSPRNRHEGL